MNATKSNRNALRALCVLQRMLDEFETFLRQRRGEPAPSVVWPDKHDDEEEGERFDGLS